MIQQIGSITAFPGSIVLIRESSELEGICTLPGLAKSSLELLTEFFVFLTNRVISRKKLHGVCILTKGYHHAKEERIWIFKLCRSMFDFCTGLPIISSLFLAQPHPTRIYHHRVCTRKDPTKFEKKNNPRSLNVPPFSVFHRGEKGFRIRRVNRAGCMF